MLPVHMLLALILTCIPSPLHDSPPQTAKQQETYHTQRRKEQAELTQALHQSSVFMIKSMNRATDSLTRSIPAIKLQIDHMSKELKQLIYSPPSSSSPQQQTSQPKLKNETLPKPNSLPDHVRDYPQTHNRQP